MTLIHPTAIIGDGAIIGEGTEVGAYAIIEAGVRLGKNNHVWPHAFIGKGTTMGDGNHVHPGASIGHLPQDLKFDPKTETFTKIGNRNAFREHCSVHRATKPGQSTIIGDDGLFMANSHVAHDCVIGNRVVMVNNSAFPGHCEIGDGVIMSGFTGIHQFCRIGRMSMVSAMSVTNKDLPPFMIFGGRPAVSQGLNAVGLRRAGVGPEARKALKAAYKLLYRSALPVTEAIARIEQELSGPEITELVAFVKASKRGICLGAGDVEETLRVRKKLGMARHAIDEDEEQIDDLG